MNRKHGTIDGRWARCFGLTCAFGGALAIVGCSATVPSSRGAGGSTGGGSGGEGGAGVGGAGGAGGSAQPPGNPTDGGNSTPDVSSPPVDAAPPKPDVSAPPPDATPPRPDSSGPTPDAAPPRPDVALPPTDGSVPPRPEAGPPPTDGGPGTTSDAPPTPTSGCGKASAGRGNFTIDVAGTPRTYVVKVPTAYDMNKPYRLIFAWHGKSGSAAQTAQGGYYRLETLSAGSAIFVAGDGFTPDEGWPNTNGRDVAFAKALLEWMRSNYCVDNSRIFSVGMSYGGIMSNTLGCQMGDVFRAITPMSGSGPRTTGGTVCIGRPAAWLAHGMADDTVSFASGQASRDHWRTVNHCADAADPVAPVPCVAYQGCDPGYPVHWCEFDGGHTIPSFASGGIWSFLAQF